MVEAFFAENREYNHLDTLLSLLKSVTSGLRHSQVLGRQESPEFARHFSLRFDRYNELFQKVLRGDFDLTFFKRLVKACYLFEESDDWATIREAAYQNFLREPRNPLAAKLLPIVWYVQDSPLTRDLESKTFLLAVRNINEFPIEMLRLIANMTMRRVHLKLQTAKRFELFRDAIDVHREPQHQFSVLCAGFDVISHCLTGFPANQFNESQECAKKANSLGFVTRIWRRVVKQSRGKLILVGLKACVSCVSFGYEGGSSVADLMQVNEIQEKSSEIGNDLYSPELALLNCTSFARIYDSKIWKEDPKFDEKTFRSKVFQSALKFEGHLVHTAKMLNLQSLKSVPSYRRAVSSMLAFLGPSAISELFAPVYLQYWDLNADPLPAPAARFFDSMKQFGFASKFAYQLAKTRTSEELELSDEFSQEAIDILQANLEAGCSIDSVFDPIVASALRECDPDEVLAEFAAFVELVVRLSKSSVCPQFDAARVRATNRLHPSHSEACRASDHGAPNILVLDHNSLHELVTNRNFGRILPPLPDGFYRFFRSSNEVDVSHFFERPAVQRPQPSLEPSDEELEHSLEPLEDRSYFLQFPDDWYHGAIQGGFFGLYPNPQEIFASDFSWPNRTAIYFSPQQEIDVALQHYAWQMRQLDESSRVSFRRTLVVVDIPVGILNSEVITLHEHPNCNLHGKSPMDPPAPEGLAPENWKFLLLNTKRKKRFESPKSDTVAQSICNSFAVEGHGSPKQVLQRARRGLNQRVTAVKTEFSTALAVYGPQVDKKSGNDFVPIREYSGRFVHQLAFLSPDPNEQNSALVRRFIQFGVDIERQARFTFVLFPIEQ